MHFIVSLVWLLVVGPLAAVGLAHLTGGLTWPRILALAAVSQVIVVVAYVTTQSMPVRVYGSELPSASHVATAKVQFGLVVVAVGMLIASAITPIARLALRD